MPRIQALTIESAEPRAGEILKRVQKSIGVVPNLYAAAAHSPAALDGVVGLNGALAGGALSSSLREQLALTIAGVNECGYCASAHTHFGKGEGLSEEEVEANILGHSTDPSVQPALTFAKRVIESKGYVTDEQLKRVRDAGFTDEQIVEIVALIAFNTFTNYFTRLSATDIDFPLVELPQPLAA